MRGRTFYYSGLERVYVYTFTKYLFCLNNKNYFINHLVGMATHWKPHTSVVQRIYLPRGYDLPIIFSEAVSEIENIGIIILCNTKKGEKNIEITIKSIEAI